MQLDKLALKNFKCFPHEEFSFGKITLLLGANSTGKSSLLQGVLAALQSEHFPVELAPNGSLASLGDFKAIVAGRRSGSSLGIALTFSGHPLGTITLDGVFVRSSRTSMPELETGSITDDSFAVRIERTDRFRAEWTYDVERDEVRKRSLASDEMRKLWGALGAFINDTIRSGSKKEPPQEVPSFDPFAVPPASGRFQFARPSEAYARLRQPRYIALTTHLGQLSQALPAFRERFCHIGSFRLEPQRTYLETSRGNLRVTRDGQNYIEQIREWQEQRAPQSERLRASLRALGLLADVRARRIANGQIEMSARPTRGKLRVSLADVGFGISQLLPMLVADLQLPDHGTLAVSQPEIHLHPSVQADLADYFVKASKKRGMRYIVETHSEYLINRMRLLVAKGVIAPGDLSVIYLSNDGTRSQAHRVTFLPDGRVEGAPKDFFTTYMVDVMNLAVHAQPR